MGRELAGCLSLCRARASPANTVVKMRYVYDNSEDNTANPNHPPARVQGGNLSTDEMAHLWLQVLPKHDPGVTGDPRMVLQEAWARHEVEKAPGSFESRYNLGEMLQARGALDQAVEQFQAAVAIRPQDAVANNALGGALLSKGDTRGSEALQRCAGFAARLLRRALQSRQCLGGARQLRGSRRAIRRGGEIEPRRCHCPSQPGNSVGSTRTLAGSAHTLRSGTAD